MGPIGWPELLIILVVVLLLFGTTRLAGLGKASGKAIREFKEETKDLKSQDVHQADAAAPAIGAADPNLQQPYVAPQQQYVAPQQQYVAPQQPYVAPQQQYGAPQQPYVVPQQPYPIQQPRSGEVFDAEVVDPDRPSN